jgi:hypothetical protein
MRVSETGRSGSGFQKGVFKLLKNPAGLAGVGEGLVGVARRS